MYYVYAIKSVKNGDLYIGYSKDLKFSFKQHNNGESIATKENRPWILVYYEAYKNIKDATKREKQLKNHRAKSDLKIQLKYSLEI
jgi:putative endonuclease